MDDLHSGCIMLSTPDLNDIISRVQDHLVSHLRTQGLTGEDYAMETYPHITVVYGIDVTTDVALLRDIVKNRPAYYQLTQLGLFENDEYDILKFDILSTDLRILNQVIQSKVPVVSTYPAYHPHLTIAYLPKGTGQDYVRLVQELLRDDLRWIQEPLSHSAQYTYSTSMEGDRIIL